MFHRNAPACATTIAAALLLGSAVAAGGDFSKMLGRGKEGGDTAQDVRQILTQGKDLLGYVTTATDQGIKGAEAVISMFPPEKVAKVVELAAKYNEMKKQRSDGNIDAEQLSVASDIAKETAALDSDWQSYKKDKAKAARSAYARLGLMLLADAQASQEAPKTLSAIQSALGKIGSNPLQATNISPLKKQVTVLSAIVKEMPGQVESFQTVRGMSKKIAEAEKTEVPADPKPEQVRSKQELDKNVKMLTD
jgi:hypothetical protein